MAFTMTGLFPLKLQAERAFETFPRKIPPYVLRLFHNHEVYKF